MNEAIEEAGNGVTEEPVITLEMEIETKLNDVRSQAQALEVGEKFLCEARSLARAGKTELAERKFKAALNVLSGGKSDP